MFIFLFRDITLTDRTLFRKALARKEVSKKCTANCFAPLAANINKGRQMKDVCGKAEAKITRDDPTFSK